MEKGDILDAIRRYAAAHGGRAPGRQRFEQETGIRESDWSGKYWARWGDALREAGYEPNRLQGARPDEQVLSALASLVRELGRFPTGPELGLARRNDPSFPSEGVFARRGNKATLAWQLAACCSEHGGLDDVAAICEPIAVPPEEAEQTDPSESASAGTVYLMKSGKHYKIGRTNSVGRRAYELTIQLPERLELVHAIETDDPVGIERYWHERFADKRGNGEWFSLSRAEVAAFRRRKGFM